MLKFSLLKIFILLFPIISILGQGTVNPSIIENGASQFYSEKCVQSILEENNEALKTNIDKWLSEDKSEPSQRMFLLWNLKNGHETDEQITNNIIENLLVYRAIMNGYKNSDTIFFLPHRFLSGYPLLYKDFNGATKTYADIIFKENKSLKNDHLSLVNFYRGNYDTLFTDIQNRSTRKSSLRKEYENYAQQIIKDPFHIRFGLLTGIWYPNKNLSKLGNHVSTGFEMGIRGIKGWGVNLTMIQRFQDIPDSVELYFNDTATYFTNNYLGGFYGIDISKNLFSRVKHEVDLSTGIAIDGFNSTYEMSDNKTFLETNIHSLNCNIGLLYSYIIRQQFFAQLQVRYNILNYKNKDGADLSGDAFSVNLLVGFISGGQTRMDILHSMKYNF